MALRGRLKFDKTGNVYFITTTISHFENIFGQGEEYNLIIINSLKHQIKEHRVSLYAYVIMPTHIHLLFHLPEGESIINFMRDFKRFTSVKIKEHLHADGFSETLKRFEEYSIGYHNQKYKIWMDRYDDLIIFTEEVFKIKFNYIHNNPVKAGLAEKPEDWKYSSSRNYILNDHSIISIRTDLSYD